jgi:membrane protein implicated in regulation of membrane protease activity
MAIAPQWWWLLAGLLLATAEVIAPGFFLIWIGAAALLTGLATLLLGLGHAGQFGLFAVGAVVALYAGRRWLRLHPIASSDPLLNDRAARLIGRTVTATEPITESGGRVRVGDGIWSALGPPAPAGSQLRVTGVEGATLRVTLLDDAAPHDGKQGETL